MKAPNRIIDLDTEYQINCDGIGVTLNYKEAKERIDTDTLETVKYVVKDAWHFLSVPQALRKYTDKVLEQSNDLKDVLKKLKEVETLIKTIK
jgi:hypothetical protein